MIRSIYRFLHPGYQNLSMEYKVDFKPRYGHGKPAHAVLYDIINASRESYKELIHKILTHKETFWSIRDNKEESDLRQPAYNNGYLPALDIFGLYTILTDVKPRKYIEVGSGNSTKVAFKAKSEHDLNTEIVSIDPMPRAEIDALADKVIREPLENTNLRSLAELEENDILFIDSSHRILPNSDSTLFYLEVLPRLRKGVIVHIHDIYLPYDYPQFMCDRFYSEQYGLAICLLSNPDRYQVLLPGYFISEDEELSGILSPIWEIDTLRYGEKHGGSFWLKIAR